VTQYDKTLDALYNKEREKTFKTINSKPFLRIPWKKKLQNAIQESYLEFFRMS